MSAFLRVALCLLAAFFALGEGLFGLALAQAHVIDGIVEAGVLPDDACPRYVEAIEDTVGEPYPRGRLVLHITEVAAEAPAPGGAS